MQSLNVKPYNSNLHLLLGANTTSYASATLLQNWAQNMIIGTNSFFSGMGFTPMTVKAAWFQAAQTAYQGSSFPSAVSFAVAGDTACQSDTLQSYSTPGGSWTYTSQQVWP